MYPLIKPDALTQVYTALGVSGAQLTTPALGERRQDKNGNLYRFVKNTHTAAIAIGDVGAWDETTNPGKFEVKQLVTATIDRLAGVWMGVVATLGFGWIQSRGYNASILMLGTIDIAAGDSLKGVTAQQYVIKDAATGTASTYHNRIVSAVVHTTDTIPALKAGYIYCE